MIVKHSYRITSEWHGFMWVWHSRRHWRTGWIIFGLDWYPGRGCKIKWPEYVKDGL